MKIESVEQAKALLAEKQSYVVYMREDFSCWIREGIPNSDGIPIPIGEYIAELSDNVFEEITKDLKQTYCSEYYQ